MTDTELEEMLIQALMTATGQTEAQVRQRFIKED